MSRRTRRNAPAKPAQGSPKGGGERPATPPAVTVCRGCCCGTPKVPKLDHAAQLARLRAAVGDSGQVRVSGCLDACERANVLVIQPSSEGRAAGGRPLWLGLANDTDVAEDVATWIDAGGPGIAEPPGVLDLYAFAPSRRIRAGLHDD